MFTIRIFFSLLIKLKSATLKVHILRSNNSRRVVGYVLCSIVNVFTENEVHLIVLNDNVFFFSNTRTVIANYFQTICNDLSSY